MDHRKQVLHLAKVVAAMFFLPHPYIVAPTSATDLKFLFSIESLELHLAGRWQMPFSSKKSAKDWDWTSATFPWVAPPLYPKTPCPTS